MQNKKSILFYLWSFSLGGGAEKILATIANNLDPEKYEIDILEMEHYDKSFPALREGVRVLKPYKGKVHSRIIEALLWRLRFLCPRLVRRKLVKDQYDVEISFTIMNPPLPFSRRKEAKKIAWVHGSIENMLENKKFYQLHREHLKCADTIVAISEKTAKSIEQVFPEYSNKIKLIYNGYDFDSLLQASKEECPIKIEEQALCSIGRIEKMKGTDRTLELLRKLHRRGYLYHLYYLGTGEQENELKDKTKAYGLEDYVHFLGYIQNPYKYLKHMKVLISMSLQEGFSGACVEALSLGVPFVTTNVGGAKELSKNGTFGKIISTDEEAIEAIIQYVSTNERAPKAKMLEFIGEFTIEKQIEKVNQLLNENYI